MLGATITFRKLLGVLFPEIKEPEWILTKSLNPVSRLRITAINKHENGCLSVVRVVCCQVEVSATEGLCDGLITRPEESYRLWCVVVCDQETS